MTSTPAFELIVDVDENAPVNTSLAELSATDRDKHSLITYRMVGDTVSSALCLNETTGSFFSK